MFVHSHWWYKVLTSKSKNSYEMIPRLIYVNIHNLLKTIEKDNQSNISTQKRLN